MDGYRIKKNQTSKKYKTYEEFKTDYFGKEGRFSFDTNINKLKPYQNSNN